MAKKSASAGKTKKGSGAGSSSGGKMSAKKASAVLRSGRSGSKQKAAAASTLAKRNPRNQRPAGKKPVSQRNTEKPWSSADEKLLRELEAENTPTRVMGIKLGRTEAAMYAKASEIGLSLKPTNRSPRP